MGAWLQVDQSAGDLTLHTGRAGIGSLVGHDLTLRVGTWRGTATLEDDDRVSDVRVVALVRSLTVLQADGGLKPLSQQDEAHILTNALRAVRAKTESEIVYEAAAVRLDHRSGQVQGRLSLAGVSRPQVLQVTVNRVGPDIQVRAWGEVLQTDFKIEPYVGLLGALKVRDRVEVRAEFTVTVP